MLTLATTNPAKFSPFTAELGRMRLRLEPLSEPLPEIQTLSFAEALSAKAKAAAVRYGRPVLVDDAGLVLEGYRSFPGPLTGVVIRGLGRAGLQRLVGDDRTRAVMECHIGCWHDGRLRCWTGRAQGQLDFARPDRPGQMLLSSIFVPEGGLNGQELVHRARALAALESDMFGLHLDSATDGPTELEEVSLPGQCPFCAEFDDPNHSIFRDTIGTRLESRVIYEDDDFIVMPPLGQFIEGGLLLLSRRHIRCFACLPARLASRLELLVGAIDQCVRRQFGGPTVVFEHGPAPLRSKGLCCVDHAHLNIFPAAIQLHPHLAHRMNLPLGSFEELARFRRAEFGYLLIQENDGSRRVYDGEGAPTQLVRRKITAHLGMPERWHWRDYPGLEELIATYQALRGRIRL